MQTNNYRRLLYPRKHVDKHIASQYALGSRTSHAKEKRLVTASSHLARSPAMLLARVLIVWRRTPACCSKRVDQTSRNNAVAPPNWSRTGVLGFFWDHGSGNGAGSPAKPWRSSTAFIQQWPYSGTRRWENERNHEILDGNTAFAAAVNFTAVPLHQECRYHVLRTFKIPAPFP
ncbi:hypothetical protein CC78DRAFT_306613 [Lojkania enalia]|uniref:Uncharacterized protein n=1 Tax=Lojkania enalia TaxID=147567 RepID=A0A9P4TPZ1_9PLEO|nr:hypothetical protein CC78DRAFT_306613 [Didymosphaeria enalia]